MTDHAMSINDIIENLDLSTGQDLSKDKLKQARQFILNYYYDLSPDDMQSLQTMDLRGAALAHWVLMQKRDPGTSLVHVYNPSLEQHGWQSSHTIVEIVTDDMPMLVNSISIELKKRELDIHLIIHPIMLCKRDNMGRLLEIPENTINTQDYQPESIMQFQVDHVSDQTTLRDIQKNIDDIIVDARCVFEDRSSMQEKMTNIANELRSNDNLNAEEPARLLDWLSQHRFVYLGYVEFELKRTASTNTLQNLPDSTLGLCRNQVSDRCHDLDELIPRKTPSYVNSEEILSVTKTNVRAPLHRSEHMDLISVPRYNKNQKIDGKHCFIGLFTSMVYNASGSDIPWISDKIQAILQMSNLKQDSHASRALQNILETYPRDTLFQTDEKTVLKTALGILQTQDRQKIRLFGSMDKYSRYCDCLVYIPRDVYQREIRIKIQQLLLEQLNGDSAEFNIEFSSESTLARIHYTVQLKRNQAIEPDWRKIEKLVVNAARSWDDDFYDALREYYAEEQANRLYKLYHAGIPGNYKEDYLPRNACLDIEHIENIKNDSEPEISFYRPVVTSDLQIKSKLYAQGHYLPLSDVIPVIENMGLKVDHERPYRIIDKNGRTLWIHEFTAHHASGLKIDPDKSGDDFKQAFLKIWKKEIENDGFNRLVLDAHLSWHQTIILRSYCKYLLQIRAPFSQTYMIETLVNNAGVTNKIVAFFEARFEPAQQEHSEITCMRLIEQMEHKLQGVSSLDEDRILRAFINLIQATMRTNFYRQDHNGDPLPYLSFKLRPDMVTDMPRPRPMFEIFVYSPRVEGVHLRGGEVARGGLRWSDRREDFRTEVLGLMKAQTVKNSVIVPVGSKGGFFVKAPPQGADREELMEEVVYCYQTFLRGLLDLTDNLAGTEVIPPQHVIRYDDDDPYLVVAADKGTATFSDIANAVAGEYKFWLGDAFASGGSVGYDHKKMGITAKGAWESVKRHFRERNHDTQKEAFSVIGIGDMGGDVFGNGMLLSSHIRLLAAFNHLHIFIDPDPDPAKSFSERKRLFDLTRSSWQDYNTSLISNGGGIFPRSAKSIELSEQALAALDIKSNHLSPDQLIHHLLQAPVDLLWNGGIGTYVKSSQESHENASDRSNDSVRVNGKQLRCTVVGEGGNLGFTQLARIEYSQHGGAIYTDAVDNSAGVDCSDHEVNIKILLDQMVQSGDMTVKQRNLLLASMTDAVAELVLKDNYLQTQCISLVAASAPQFLDNHARFMAHLESQNQLDRALEFLPDHETIAERLASQKGLVLPELSVLVSYAKMTLFKAVIQSELPDDAYLSRRLNQYFPQQLSEKYAPAIAQHRLFREIIATHIVNDLVNRLGPTFVFELQDELAADPVDVCKAFDAISSIFDMEIIWQDIEALDNKIKDSVQQELSVLVRGLVERAIHWLIRTRRVDQTVEEIVEYFKPLIAELTDKVPHCLAKINKKSYSARVKYFSKAGVPEDLAVRAAKVVPLSSSLDIVEISKSLEQPIETVGAVYFALGSHLDLQWLRDQIAELTARNHWHTLAQSGLRSDLHYQQRHLTAEIMRSGKVQKSAIGMVEKWSKNNPAITQYSTLIGELKASSVIDFTMLSLALNEVHKLLQSDRPLGNEIPL